MRNAGKTGSVSMAEFPRWEIVSEYWAVYCKIDRSFGKNTSGNVLRFWLLITVPNCQENKASFCALVKVGCYAPLLYWRVSLTVGNRDCHPKTASFHARLDAFLGSVCLLGCRPMGKTMMHASPNFLLGIHKVTYCIGFKKMIGSLLIEFPRLRCHNDGIWP